MSAKRALPLIVLAAVTAAVALAGWPRLPASAAQAGVTYQAESAALTGGAMAQSDHTGFTGSGFVGGFTDGNLGAAAVTFTVNASPSGAYTSSLRYANGTGSTRTLSVYVAGQKKARISLPATADWDTWATVGTSLVLAAGSNTVAYRFDSTEDIGIRQAVADKHDVDVARGCVFAFGDRTIDERGQDLGAEPGERLA